MTTPNESFTERYAHTLPDRPPASWETLADHLNKVEDSASTFAEAFGARRWGEILGRCHDLGKLSDEFQRYLRKPGVASVDAGVEDEAIPGRVDHSTFGARFVQNAVGKVFGQLLAFCIAGHHTGLPDETSAEDTTQRSTLRHKLDPTKYSIPAVAVPDIELPALKSPLKPSAAGRADVPFQLAFFTRMLFSCLIDADRTRTEEFCDPDKSLVRGGLGAEHGRPSLAALKNQLDASLLEKEKKAEPTEVNRQRTLVLGRCREAAVLQPGFFSLNVPTGGGKTLSSLAFALDHALIHNFRRVVVAIPFTSIIEQTADVYRAALAPFAEAGLVEHHTNLQPRHDTRANQFGAENWDAPLIVTTNVQLFESLFAYRTTPCRKLHNLARSVIVLDEAQTIPVELLRPALAALRELVLNYGCSIVLCTATQPALERRNEFEIGLEGIRPIIPDAVPLFHALRRVEVRMIGKLPDAELALRLAQQKAVPVVYRAEAGFDSIAQAAGRCNREGLLDLGLTYVFEAEEKPPAGLLRAAAEAGKELCSKYRDPLTPEAIEAYFRLLYWIRTYTWDKHKVMEKMGFDHQRCRALLQFREVADAFRMIEDDQIPVLIPCYKRAAILRDSLMAGSVPFIPQRELQPYLVSVRKEAMRQLNDRGFVTEHESGVWLLLNRSIYSGNKGLDPASTRLDESLWGV